MNRPNVDAPIHDNSKNSFWLITVMEGLTTNGVGSEDWETGMTWNSDEASRSSIL